MTDKEFENIFFVVEATNCEHAMLWENWSKESIEPKGYGTLLNWSGRGAYGFSVQIGTLDKRPVNVSILFDTINGAKIVFYEAVSQVVDYKMVRAWIDENLTSELPDGRVNHCDANNFHQCMHALQKYACESVNT